MTILISFVSDSSAVIENLSDIQLGDFYAAEGVCDINLIEGCNTSPSLKLVLGSTKLSMEVPEFRFKANENIHDAVVPQNFNPELITLDQNYSGISIPVNNMNAIDQLQVSHDSQTPINDFSNFPNPSAAETQILGQQYTSPASQYGGSFTMAN